MFRDTRFKNSCLLVSLFGAGYLFGNLDHDLSELGIIGVWLNGTAQFSQNLLQSVSHYSSSVLSGMLLLAGDIHKYPLLIVAALISVGIQIIAPKKPVLPARNSRSATAAIVDPMPQTALSQLPALAPKRQAERNTDDEATSTAAAIPRVLLNNPYDKKIEYLTFEERVQIAVQASVRKGRVIGVIYFHLSFTPRDANGAQALTADDDVILHLAAELESQLRATDCVKCVSNTEIAVFVSLMSDVAQLNSVAQRLSATLTRLMLEDEFVSAQITQGSVLYPMGGYSSVALIASARQKAKLSASNPLSGSQLPTSAESGHSRQASNRGLTAFTVN